MLKYIFLALLLIAFILNFKVKSAVKFVLKKEITQKQEMAAKGIIYVVALVCVICIMVFC